MFKKIFLTIGIFLICSNAHATVWYACSGGGNWNGLGVWTSILADEIGCTASTGNPVAGDTATLNSNSGNITITSSAAAASMDETGYVGTLAFGTQTLTLTSASSIGGAMTSTSGTITTTGNITLLSTATGSFPTLTITGADTLISGGFTWPGALTLSVSGIVILNGNWINSGVLQYNAATNLNVTTSETMTTNGGLNMNAASGTSPTATIILGGGTWSGFNTLSNNLTFSGNSTVSGTVEYKNGTLLYSSGVVTTTGSTLDLVGLCTVNTNGIVWGTIAPQSTNTFTLSSNLNALILTLNDSFTPVFSGAFNITVSTLNNIPNGSSSAGVTLASGQSLNVTSSINLNSAVTLTFTIKSSTASSPTYFNYTGNLANESISGVVFTDVSASAPSIPGYGPILVNYNGGTLTRTKGIKNITAANINKKPINYYTGV